ncbi:flagellar hook-associated protein 2 [Bacillus sp. S13(2024)]|uniref:flagellar hook-associated protein 2 n=1 Tax=unclassified Bacillus (in: firmicutes) TaxID=185979 RepID=UPI003D2048EC
MAGTITGIGGGQQIWNLGNNMIDTSQLVQLELQTLEMRKSPYNTQKKSLTDEKAVYSSLKTQFSPFAQTFKDLAAFKGGDKKVTLSQDGYVNIQADGSAIGGTFNIEVTELAQRHQISSGSIADINAKIGVDDTIKINGTDLKITADMTYKDLINKVNNGSYGVSAYTLGDKIFISSTKEGTSSAIKLTDGTTNFLKNSGFLGADGAILNEITVPKNAQYTINGITDTSESNTISKLPGVTIQLEKATPVNTQITFTVADSNIKDSVDIIKKMVADYNKGVSAMDLFSGENGALQGQTVMQSIRKAMNDAVTFTQNGKYLFSFGIQVNKDGTLQVDETKLTNALKEDPAAAKQFFFGVDGLGKQIDQKLDKIFGETGTIGEHVQSIDKRVTDLDRKIADIDKINKQKQDAIVKKYSDLEKQLAMLDTQLKSIQAMTKQKSSDE